MVLNDGYVTMPHYAVLGLPLKTGPYMAQVNDPVVVRDVALRPNFKNSQFPSRVLFQIKYYEALRSLW